MILSSQEDIKKFTEMGIWSSETLIDRFKKHVLNMSDNVCMIDPMNKKDLLGLEPERLTYKEFDRAVDATAEALIARGLKKDDIVMVQIPNCWELAMLYLAIARTGAIISPAPVLLRESEMTYIAEITKAKIFITTEKFNNFSHKEMGKILQKKCKDLKEIITYEEIREMCKGEVTGKLDNIKIDSNDVFTICWTSGTEASPKGCPLSHNNWIGMASLQDAVGLKSGDTLMVTGPMVNMAAVGTIFIPWLVFGGSIVIHHPFEPTIFMTQIMQEKVNYLILVPAILNIIAKHPQVDTLDLSSVRSISTGSAPPSLWTMQEFKRRWGTEIGNIWGQNEGSGIVSGIDDIPDMKIRVDHFPHFGKSGVKWKSVAAKYIETKIIDALGKELTNVNDVGELVYKGPAVIPCYFRNSEMTKKGFTEDGYFKTGDLFQIRENNFLSFFERSKDIIIRGGYNISSQEIENYLVGHPNVQDAAVVSMPDEVLGERMCAFVVPIPNMKVTLKDLILLLTKIGVAKYKYPERLEVVDIIPRNPVGKIIKSELRKNICDKIKS